MIYINLLPQEFRARQRMSLKNVALMGGLVAANCSLLAWAAWLWFGEYATTQSDRQVAQETLDSLQAQIAYVKALEGEKKSFESRESTLVAIAQNRVGWTAKVDQIIDVINKGGSGEKYLIWLDDLTISRQYDKNTKTAGMFKAQASCGGESVGMVANFLDDLQDSEFFAGFDAPKPPEGKMRDDGADLVPSSAWMFELELKLRSQDKEAEKPAKAAKAGKSAKPKAPQAATEEQD
jgi:Tfp pilus assembly protein PilN